jgi:hypothetical protein
MPHYTQLDLKLIPDDGKSIGEHVKKSICARENTAIAGVMLELVHE